MKTNDLDRELQSVVSSQPLLAGRWLDFLTIIFAGLAWAATPLLAARSLGADSGTQQLAAALGGLVVGAIVLLLAAHVRTVQIKMAYLHEWKLPSLGVILIAGLALRLLWTWTFPASTSSDGATYLRVALGLLADGQYEAAGTRAYWPPGYPFFLVPWLLVFSPALAVLLSQLSLYLAGAAGCFKLARTLAGDRAGRFAALLFTLWPNLVAITGTPEKEALILALLPWICVGVLKRSVLAMALAGAAMGFAILVQPSLQLLLVGFLILIPLMYGWRGLYGAIVLVICAAVVISPWTLRNYHLFGELVLVSTNGGDNLYRANNPLADGGYTDKGEFDFSGFGEVEHDRVAKRQAIQWAAEHPVDFLELVLEKQLRFMGDDAAGVYNTLKRGGGSDSAAIYAIVKFGSNAWWMAIWLLIARFACTGAHERVPYRIVIWCWLYLFALHSVFESSGKYHIPMLWVLCVWLGCAVTARQTQSIR